MKKLVLYLQKASFWQFQNFLIDSYKLVSYKKTRNRTGFHHCTTLRKTYSELFWSVFSRIRTEYGEILRISPYSVRMWGNTDQNDSEYGHFSRSAIDADISDYSLKGVSFARKIMKSLLLKKIIFLLICIAFGSVFRAHLSIYDRAFFCKNS